jgi:hypothetical protein
MSSFFPSRWDLVNLFSQLAYLSLLVAWDDRCLLLHPAIGWDGGLPFSFLFFWLPWTVTLMISASQVARITGINHWHLVSFFSLWINEPLVFYYRNKKETEQLDIF